MKKFKKKKIQNYDKKKREEKQICNVEITRKYV